MSQISDGIKNKYKEKIEKASKKRIANTDIEGTLESPYRKKKEKRLV